MVFERASRLDEYFKTGTLIDGRVSEQLIRNIFFPNASLHDGAMVIRDGRVAAAGCVLPLSENHHLSADLGTRHRAGVGVSELTDAVVVIVSEETGTISVAVGGMLKRHLAPQTLQRLLTNELAPAEEEGKGKRFVYRAAGLRERPERMRAMKSKLPTLLLSFIVAMGLWLYVVTTVSPEADQNYTGIPVVFENETSLLDRGLMLVSGENATVSVRLYGKRANLNRLTSSNIIVTADLKAVTEPGKYELEYKVSYPSGITNVSLDKRITPSVTVEAVEFAEKDVPVELVFQGEQQEGLILDQEEAMLSAETVHVSGAKNEVDQVTKAGILIDRTGLTENLVGDFVYTLMNENSEPVDVPHVETDTGRFT